MTARLVPLSEGSNPVTLDKAITLIGRHPDCDAVLDDNQKISRRHCCIAQVENRLVLRDLGSMNGVRVNGEQVVEVDLREGDQITIGDEEFVLQLKTGAGVKKRGDEAVPPTPDKPKRTPRPSGPVPPTSRRSPKPADINNDFPVAIPDEAESDHDDDDDQLVTPESPPVLPASAVDKLILNFPNDQLEDDGVFKLDSGVLELGDLDKKTQ